MSKFDPGTFKEYKETGIFRLWCQKVMPLVYDDSLSYYELLCKVVAQLNQMAVNMNTHEDNFKKMQDIFFRLIDYVNDFTDSVEFDQKIEDKLDEMAADGSLSALVNAAMELEHATLRRKLLPMTGTLNELMRDERETSIRVVRLVESEDDEQPAKRRVVFRRGGSNFTISMNPTNAPGAYGLVNFIRGVEVGLAYLYRTDYTEDTSDLVNTHMYFDGEEKTYSDLKPNDLFSNIVIYKVQNKTDDTITKEIVEVIDGSSLKIFMKYSTAPDAKSRIHYGSSWTDLLWDSDNGMQITYPANGKVIELDQDQTWEANKWHKVDISW